MSTERFLKRIEEIQKELERSKRKEGGGAHAGAHDESNWLVSYADMMTLLCGFFVMMFSLSTVNPTKYEKVREEIAKEMGTKFESPVLDLKQEITQILQEAGVESQTTIASDPMGVSVVFHSTLFFDTLSSDLRGEGKTIMEKLIAGIQKNEAVRKKKYRIIVEGHTDSRPVLDGIFPSNWELSSARASRVVRLLMEKGFEANRLVPIGYGETRPQVADRTPTGEYDESALKKNRRVVIRVLSAQADSIPWDDSAATAPAATAVVTPPVAVTSPAEAGPATPAVAPAPAPSSH